MPTDSLKAVQHAAAAVAADGDASYIVPSRIHFKGSLAGLSSTSNVYETQKASDGKWVEYITGTHGRGSNYGKRCQVIKFRIEITADSGFQVRPLEIRFKEKIETKRKREEITTTVRWDVDCKTGKSQWLKAGLGMFSKKAALGGLVGSKECREYKIVAVKNYIKVNCGTKSQLTSAWSSYSTRKSAYSVSYSNSHFGIKRLDYEVETNPSQ